MYVAGYSIGKPSLSHGKMGELLHPRTLCSLKKLHDGGQSSDFIRDIHAGLHYLVGEVSPREKIVWGRYPDAKRSEHTSINPVTKVKYVKCFYFSLVPRPFSASLSMQVNLGTEL